MITNVVEQHVWTDWQGEHTILFVPGLTVWKYPPNRSVALHHLGTPANDEPDPLNLLDEDVSVWDVLDQQALEDWNNSKFESWADYEWVN